MKLAVISEMKQFKTFLRHPYMYRSHKPTMYLLFLTLGTQITICISLECNGYALTQIL